MGTPAAVGRVFTVLELARLVGETPSVPTGSGAQRWRSLVERARMSRGLVRPAQPDDDDLPDPVGCPVEVHVAVLDECVRAVQAIVAGLALEGG